MSKFGRKEAVFNEVNKEIQQVMEELQQWKSRFQVKATNLEFMLQSEHSNEWTDRLSEEAQSGTGLLCRITKPSP